MISENIKTLRLDKGISQNELANELNLSRQTISKWENNRALPDIENIILLSKYFNTDLLELANIKIDDSEVKSKNKVTGILKKLKISAYIFIGVTLTTLAFLFYNVYTTYYRSSDSTIELVGFKGIISTENKLFLEDMSDNLYEITSYNNFVRTLLFKQSGTRNYTKKQDEQLNSEITKSEMKNLLKTTYELQKRNTLSEL